MKNEALNEINVLTAQLGSLDSKIEKLKVEVTNEKIESAVQIDVGFNVVREQANIVSLVQTLVLLVLSRKLLTPCRNLPFGGRATRSSRVRLPREENVRSHHQRLFEGKRRKNRKGVVYEL